MHPSPATNSTGTTVDASQQTSMASILLALVLPLVLNAVLSESKDHLVDTISKCFLWLRCAMDGVDVTRTLERVQHFDRYGYATDDDNREDRNEILLKAITAYIHAHPSPSLCGRVSLCPRRPAPGADKDEDGEDYSASNELKKLAISLAPAPDVKTRVRDDGADGAPPVYLEISRFSKTHGAGDKGKANEVTAGRSSVTTTFSLTATGGAAAEGAIDGFVGDCLAFYRGEVAAAETRAGRSMYSPIPKSENQWKKYALSDEKTFDTMFFAAKGRVLRALDSFEAGTGKFSIEGYPRKLGLLLHGPPGTGKTSLIKAIAHRTKRHVVNLPLSRVKSNQQLRDWLFDERFDVEGDGADAVKLSECVFVMEDVDACSDVVLDRDAAGGAADAKPHGDDRLTLAGLLNALDGIVDAPRRIVVMTTNHPEKLDPALIRPGRVTLKLYLGYVDAASADAMCRHYFGPSTPPGVGAAVAALAAEGTHFSPAQLEHLCASHATAEELRLELANGLLRLRAERGAAAADVRATLDRILADRPPSPPAVLRKAPLRKGALAPPKLAKSVSWVSPADGLGPPLLKSKSEPARNRAASP